MWSIKWASVIVVPVLPTPALQCTTTFSYASEFKRTSMNSVSIN